MSDTLLTSDEQLLLGWLQRATGANNDFVEDIFEPPRCARCGSTALQGVGDSGDIVCVACGVLCNDGRAISADDGVAQSQHRRGADLLDERQAKRARNADDDKHHGQQLYQRAYHFNERIAARNNVEPRVPLSALRIIDRVLHYVLSASYSREQLTPETIQLCCRALQPLGLHVYAERWLQIRYYCVTGRTERRFNESEHPQWDIQWLKNDEVHRMRWYFKKLAQCFDELYYRPSSRFTRKDLHVMRSRHTDARHNILQLNYMIQTITRISEGEQRYQELRTDFCFPVNRSPKARAKLNRMMETIVYHFNCKNDAHDPSNPNFIQFVPL